MKKQYHLLLVLSTCILFPALLHAQDMAMAAGPRITATPKHFGQSKPSYQNMFKADSIAQNNKMKKMMNSPGMGALTGFVIGGTGGVLLGLTGKEWVLKNGKTVSRPIHAVVDALIVGAPLAIMGLCWGARKPRATLAPSKWHVAIGGGWSSGMPYQSMLNAAKVSGLPRHIPHWFGYLHYPNGQNSSTPYTWNLSLDYNIVKHFSAGLAFNNFVQQKIVEGSHHNDTWHDYEYARGESYSLLGDYIINPIKPKNKTRLVFAVGGGASLHRMLAGGVLGTTVYQEKKVSVTPHWRITIDYMSTRKLSLQLKAGYKPYQTIVVPDQRYGSLWLLEHGINYRALDVTIGMRYHFNTFSR